MTAQCRQKGCQHPPTRKGYCLGHYQALIRMAERVRATVEKPTTRPIHESEFLYVIGITGNRIYKVGRSSDPVKRMANLQCAIPIDLTLEAVFCVASSGAEQLERAAHRALVRHNVRGEWFRLDANEIVGAIQKCATDMETAIMDTNAALAMCREDTATTGGRDEIFGFEDKLRRIRTALRTA